MIRSCGTKKGFTVFIFGLALIALARAFLDKAHTEIRALVTAATRGVGAILEGGKYLVHSVVNDWRDGAVGL